MDKSIEERANKFALEKHPYSPFYEEYTKMYIEIATEQKAIDEELMLKMDGYKQGFYDGFVEALIAVKKELRKAEADDLYDYKNAIITLETEQKNIVKNLLKQLEE